MGIRNILEIEYHYYFFTKRGVTTIKGSLIEINTSINTQYEEMTPEQLDFYLEHPNASIREIRECKLDSPYVPPTPEIEVLRANAISDLQSAYCASIKVGELQLAAATVDHLKRTNSVILKDVEDIMPNADSVNIIKNFASSYNRSTAIYSSGVAAINAATDAETISSELDTYKQQLAAL